MSYQYRIYGLHINSSAPIGLLQEKQNQHNDISLIWTTDINATPYPNLQWERYINESLKNRNRISIFTADTTNGTYYNLNYHTDAGELFFLVNPEKNHVWIVYNELEPAYNMQSILVGPALGAILRLRGTVCLHSSVININNKAVAFLGPKYAGKSTTAAAFAKAGYKVLADDMGVIKPTSKGIFIESGYPKVRLRPQSLTAIHSAEPETFQQVYPQDKSRYTNVEHKFQEEALPLGAVYFLNPTQGTGAMPAFENVMPMEKLITVSEHSFASYMLSKDLRKQQFILLGKLAQQIPVRKINFQHDLAMLDILCKEIVADFTQIS